MLTYLKKTLILLQILRRRQILFVREQNFVRVRLRGEVSLRKYGIQPAATVTSQEANVNSTSK